MSDLKKDLQKVAEGEWNCNEDIQHVMDVAQRALREIKRLEELPPGRKRIRLKTGYEWYVWDDGYRWYVQPTSENPNTNMRDPTCVFEYKHNDQPAGFMEFVFDSLKGEDS